MQLIHGDCLVEMPAKLDWNGEIACIITDPAYWTLNKWREIGTTTRLGGHRDADKRVGWFETIDAQDLWECIVTFGLILPDHAHCWIMCDHETMPYVLGYVREDDTPFNYSKPYPVLKRTKDGSGYRQGMGYHGRASHEYVVLLEKGRRKFNDENWPDVFSIPWTGDSETRGMLPNNKPFPTAKPVAFYERLIELSTKPGDTVLDPFMGSGTCAIACLNTGRDFIGIEKDKAYYDMAYNRVAAHYKTPTQQALRLLA